MIDYRKTIPMATTKAKDRESGVFICNISSDEIEAAAKAWLTWQFNGKSWETATPQLQEKFREGARIVLSAAAIARSKKI